MQRLLDAAKNSWVSDIDRASMFLERARDVRVGCRDSRTVSREAPAGSANTPFDRACPPYQNTKVPFTIAFQSHAKGLSSLAALLFAPPA